MACYKIKSLEMANYIKKNVIPKSIYNSIYNIYKN